MKTKYILSVVAIVAITKSGFAQYSADAVRFAQTQNGSTARIKALGNAGTAVGGDMSSISGNPAGLGFFTKSELSITPEFNYSQVNSSFYGTPTSIAQTNNASTGNMNFNNASAVFYTRMNTAIGQNKYQGLLSLNFGVSYNRNSDFYENVTYGGINAGSSITNYYKQLADADPNTPFDGTLQNFAFNHFLIDSVGYNAQTKGSIYQANVNPPTNQLVNTVRSGGVSTFNVSMGANYGNQLYVGLGIGITSLRYNATSTFTETGYQNRDKFNYSSQFTQDQVTKGTGFNATLGFIYKPVDELRIGGSITTPTWYTIDDNYNESLFTQYTGNKSYSDGPASYPFTYSLRTPLKVSGGVAVFFQKHGFLTADAEYIDYSSMHLDNSNTTADGYANNSTYNANPDNHDIATLYQSTVNLHVGGEARLSSDFALRAGYGLQGNPLKNTGYNNATKTISGGFGYRTGIYYIDATYTNVSSSQAIYPYVLDASSGLASPYANLNRTYNNVYLTLGLRF